MNVRANKRTISGIAAATVLFCGLVVIGSQVQVFGVGQASSSVEAKPIVVNILKSGDQFDMDLLKGSILVLEAPDQITYQSSAIQVNGNQGNCEFAMPIPPGPYKLVMSVLGLRIDMVVPPTPNSAVILEMNISPMGISIQMPLILRNEKAESPQTTPIRPDASNPPVVLSRVELEYPPEAKALRIAGSARAEVVVNEDGEVYEANILACHPLFQKPAVDALMQWKFQPLKVNGEPKPFVTTVTLNFHY